ELHGAASAEAVLELVKNAHAAAPVVDAILAFYRAAPEIRGEELVRALLDLAASGEPAVKARITILAELPRFKPELDARLRRQLEPLLSSPDASLVQEARILLALLGDRAEKKSLVRSYDDAVAKSNLWWPAYERRAELLVRLAQYEDAAKDY